MSEQIEPAQILEVVVGEHAYEQREDESRADGEIDSETFDKSRSQDCISPLTIFSWRVASQEPHPQPVCQPPWSHTSSPLWTLSTRVLTALANVLARAG